MMGKAPLAAIARQLGLWLLSDYSVDSSAALSLNDDQNGARGQRAPEKGAQLPRFQRQLLGISTV